MAQNGQNLTVTGLGTFALPITSTGQWNVKGKITLPSISEGNTVNSSIVVTMNINGGSTLYTGVAGAEGFETGSSATAGDTLNVILTSAATVDQGLNTVKTTISLF